MQIYTSTKVFLAIAGVALVLSVRAAFGTADTVQLEAIPLQPTPESTPIQALW